MNNVKNQTHQRITHKTPKDSENILVRVYYKDGDSTMLIAKNVPLCVGRSLEAYMKSTLQSAKSKLQGKFIYTKCCTQQNNTKQAK